MMIKKDREFVSYPQAAVMTAVVFFLTLYFQILNIHRQPPIPLSLPLLIFFCGVYLFYFKKASTRLFLNCGFLLSLLFFLTHYIQTYTTIPPLYLPVASVGMLVILLFNDLQLAFLMSLLSSVLTVSMLGEGMNLMMVFFLGALMGVYSVRDARTRGKVITAGLNAGLLQAITLALMTPDTHVLLSREFFLFSLRPLFFSGLISSFVVMATLKIFESVFGVLSNFSLLELADKDQPLLKRMSLEAPGTFHHSMVVSDLAEAAADAIGANALLTRVGAYYHDIGKMDRSEYFTENQIVGGNKHDNIEPSISRLVILNHVKEGIELAKKHKLNPIIIDFIPQHHGTSLMYYFYQKALEEAEDPKSVNEDNYRYPGPKPQTKEAAIILLADSVEGATRALDEPNPQKIEEVVRKIINNKFIDGQLDECNLTLKEIDAIARTFTRVLCAIYHGRIKYPEKKNGSAAPRNQKSAEKRQDSSQNSAEGSANSSEEQRG